MTAHGSAGRIKLRRRRRSAHLAGAPTPAEMFRLVLLAALAAGSLATFNGGVGGVVGGIVGGGVGGVVGGVVGGGALDLGGLLSAGDVGPAIKLVQARYSGISSPAAVQIIRLAVSQPPAAILPRIQYTAVPAISGRLSYLQSLFGALPSAINIGGYTNGIISHLGSLGFRIYPASLVDPLALTDYHLAGSLMSPVSIPAFSSFFTSRIIGIQKPYSAGFYSLPTPQAVITRLGGISLGKLHNVFRPIVIGAGSIVGPGASIAPIISQIGLPGLVQPTVTLGGLADYLKVQRVPVRRFVQRIRVIKAPQITRLIRPIQIAPIVQRLSFVSSPVIRRDILPTLALRYLSLPSILQSNLNFGRIVPGYFGSSLLPSGTIWSRAYVSSLLNGFDGYIHSRLKGYRGHLWGKGLIYG